VLLTYLATLFLLPTVNECESDNGGCAHHCVDTLLSYTCSCNDGYLLDADDRECIGKFEIYIYIYTKTTSGVLTVK
jgi:hypothetical protein